ncbi:MAG: ComEA family DNA-binding protein [Myxococcota bacterium]
MVLQHGMNVSANGGRGARLARALLLGMVLCAASADAHADEGASSGEPALVVNLNTATEAELERLPGIGPARARAIVELRDRLGGYKQLGQVLRVRGIGRATFRKLRPMITLEDPR